MTRTSPGLMAVSPLTPLAASKKRPTPVQVSATRAVLTSSMPAMMAATEAMRTAIPGPDHAARSSSGVPPFTEEAAFSVAVAACIALPPVHLGSARPFAPIKLISLFFAPVKR